MWDLIVYIDNSQSMRNYNVLKFIDTWSMISFDYRRAKQVQNNNKHQYRAKT